MHAINCPNSTNTQREGLLSLALTGVSYLLYTK